MHSFPSHAVRLSSTSAKATERITTDVKGWHGVGAAQTLPLNGLFINGAHVPLGGNTFNVYDMLHVVRSELEHVAQLASFQEGTFALTASDVAALKAAADGLAGDDASQEKHTARVDVSRGAKHAVTFANNIERDAQYKQWPKKLATLLQPAWQIHQIRRNLYTVVALADALSYDGALLTYQLNMIVSQQYPIRMGFVPVCDTDSVGQGEDRDRRGSYMASSVDVCNLFAVLREKYSPAAATAFLGAVSQLTLERGQRQQQACACDAPGGGVMLLLVRAATPHFTHSHAWTARTRRAGSSAERTRTRARRERPRNSLRRGAISADACVPAVTHPRQLHSVHPLFPVAWAAWPVLVRAKLGSWFPVRGSSRVTQRHVGSAEAELQRRADGRGLGIEQR